MLQRKEIGKYRSVDSRIEAMLNREYITPGGDHYSLIKYEKSGHNKSLTYQWVENPQYTITSDHMLSLGEIVDWIKVLKEKILYTVQAMKISTGETYLILDGNLGTTEKLAQIVCNACRKIYNDEIEFKVIQYPKDNSTTKKQIK